MQRFRSFLPAGVLLPLCVLALATLRAALMLSGAAETARPGNVAAEASPTPAALPETGGAPASASRPDAVAPAVLAVVSTVVVAAAGTIRRV